MIVQYMYSFVRGNFSPIYLEFGHNKILGKHFLILRKFDLSSILEIEY